MSLFRRNRARGQSSVEFVLIFAAFVVVFLAMTDMMKICYNWLGIQFSSNRGIRQAKMMPTTMDYEEKATLIRTKIIEVADRFGVELSDSNIQVAVDASTISVETQKDVTLTPVSGLLLTLGGDHSGVYNLRTREVIRNAEI